MSTRALVGSNVANVQNADEVRNSENEASLKGMENCHHYGPTAWEGAILSAFFRNETSVPKQEFLVNSRFTHSPVYRIQTREVTK
jgi:hypothetical protein